MSDTSIEMEAIIRKKKVDLDLLNYHCVGKDGYLTYNTFVKKDKHKLTKDEYLLLKGYKNGS